MVDNSPSIVIIIIISVCQDYNNIKCIIKPRYIENSFFPAVVYNNVFSQYKSVL